MERLECRVVFRYHLELVVKWGHELVDEKSPAASTGRTARRLAGISLRDTCRSSGRSEGRHFELSHFVIPPRWTQRWLTVSPSWPPSLLGLGAGPGGTCMRFRMTCVHFCVSFVDRTGASPLVVDLVVNGQVQR